MQHKQRPKRFRVCSVMRLLASDQGVDHHQPAHCPKDELTAHLQENQIAALHSHRTRG